MSLSASNYIKGTSAMSPIRPVPLSQIPRDVRKIFPSKIGWTDHGGRSFRIARNILTSKNRGYVISILMDIVGGIIRMNVR